MLYFSASVLKAPSSTSRISRRITLSRVVVLPVNVMRLTKNCLPFLTIRIVTSTTGGLFPADCGSGAASAAGAAGSSGSDRRGTCSRENR